MLAGLSTAPRRPVQVTVAPTIKGVRLGRTEVPYGAVSVRATGEAPLEVNGEPLAREVLFYRLVPRADAPEDELRVQVVARVGMEAYLTGVVPHEMPAHWPVEALRAQCVASRTYAYYKIRTRTDRRWDVKDSSASQVWRPGRVRNPIVNMVVNSTRGVVMTDNWRLFPAYFSAECGGSTKDGVHVFINRHIAPLTGVRCPHCDGPPGAREWLYEVPVDELAVRLRRAGYDVGRIRRLRALDEHGRTRTDMGPVYDVTVEHEVDDHVRMLTLPAETRFRGAIGNRRDQLASTFFSVTIRDGMARFTGRGHGHGVGLCQYGARHLADEGASYQAILDYYYVGNTLVRLWEG